MAKTAEERGIKTVNKFFGMDTANELKESGNQADVLLGNKCTSTRPGST